MTSTQLPANNRPLKSVKLIWNVLGILVGALSISSLVQHWGDINLAELTHSVINKYRANADQLKYLLFDWWIGQFWPNWIMPAWLFDVFILWLLSSTANIRALRFRVTPMLVDLEAFGTKLTIAPEAPKLLSKTLYAALGPIGLFRSIYDALFAPDIIKVEENSENNREFAKALTDEATRLDRANRINFIVIALAPLLATLLFFVWNAILL